MDNKTYIRHVFDMIRKDEIKDILRHTKTTFFHPVHHFYIRTGEQLIEYMKKSHPEAYDEYKCSVGLEKTHNRKAKRWNGTVEF